MYGGETTGYGFSESAVWIFGSVVAPNYMCATPTITLVFSSLLRSSVGGVKRADPPLAFELKSGSNRLRSARFDSKPNNYTTVDVIFI